MINKIVEQLYVGEWRDALLLVNANPEGITAVLNVCEEQDDFSSLPWIKYLHAPFADERPIPKESFDLCMAWLAERYKVANRILIHCAIGRSRSPTICAAFMAKYGLVSCIEEGLSLVKSSRTQADPSPLTYGSAKAYLGLLQ